MLFPIMAANRNQAGDLPTPQYWQIGSLSPPTRPGLYNRVVAHRDRPRSAIPPSLLNKTCHSAPAGADSAYNSQTQIFLHSLTKLTWVAVS